jgi:uncharacterized protein (DUF3084 family)
VAGAENERQAAEKVYKDFMNSDAALQLREDDFEAYSKKITELNATIEAANKKVRTTRENI